MSSKSLSRWHRPDCRRPGIDLSAKGFPLCRACDSSAAEYLESDRGTLSVPWTVPSHDPKVPFVWPTFVKWTEAPSSRVGVNCKDSSRPWTHGQQSRHIRTPDDQILYQSLGHNSIRLLRLDGASSASDPLHGTLITETIDRDFFFHTFEALSYTWADLDGSRDRSEAIFLNPHWDISRITSNCADALRRLRLEREDRMLWVDAVCINQDDADERSRQVQLMPKIYSKAQRVVVFVGEGDAMTDLAMRFLDDPESLEPTESYSLAIDAVVTMLNRPYFSRVWILQEIALARDVVLMAGVRSVPWSAVNSGYLRLFALGSKVQEWMASGLFDLPRAGYSKPNDLVRILLSTRDSVSSDPRDRVFSVLGLLTFAKQHGLVADYNLSLESLFVGAAAYAVTRGDMTPILLAPSARAVGCPSWVPDWAGIEKTPDDIFISLVKQLPERMVLEMLGVNADIERPDVYEHYLRYYNPLGAVLDVVDQEKSRPRSRVRGSDGALSVLALRLSSVMPDKPRDVESGSDLPENLRNFSYYRHNDDAKGGQPLPSTTWSFVFEESERNEPDAKAIATSGEVFVLAGVPLPVLLSMNDTGEFVLESVGVVALNTTWRTVFGKRPEPDRLEIPECFWMDQWEVVTII